MAGTGQGQQPLKRHLSGWSSLWANSLSTPCFSHAEVVAWSGDQHQISSRFEGSWAASGWNQARDSAHRRSRVRVAGWPRGPDFARSNSRRRGGRSLNTICAQGSGRSPTPQLFRAASAHTRNHGRHRASPCRRSPHAPRWQGWSGMGYGEVLLGLVRKISGRFGPEAASLGYPVQSRTLQAWRMRPFWLG